MTMETSGFGRLRGSQSITQTGDQVSRTILEELRIAWSWFTCLTCLGKLNGMIVLVITQIGI
nr:unnamed protein product [Callosobruchus analis]